MSKFPVIKIQFKFSLLSISLLLFVNFACKAEEVYIGDEEIPAPGILENILPNLDDLKQSLHLSENKENQLSPGVTTGLDTTNGSWEIKDIYSLPGTRWCGNENLVAVVDVDKCCTHHDACFQSIPAKEENYNLTNSGLVTRSHCRCDAEFYSCLKKCEKNEDVANAIGKSYFNLLKPQCFRKEYPVLGCWKKGKNGVCLHYNIDRKKERIYQWFDNPTF